MGLISWAKKKVEKTPEQKFQQQREQADKIAFKQKEYEAEKKGFESARLKRAEARGKQRGSGGGGFGSGLGSMLEGVGGAINNTERNFGFSGGPSAKIGSNLDIFSPGSKGGLGGNIDIFNQAGGRSERKREGGNVETVTVSRSGTVKIKRPVQSVEKKEKYGSPYGWMDDIDDNLLG